MTDRSTSDAGVDGAALSRHRLGDGVERLTASILADGRTFRSHGAALPDRDEVAALIERLRWLVFPGFFGPRNIAADAMRAHVAALLHDLVQRLDGQLNAAFRHGLERRGDEVNRIEPGDLDAECARRSDHALRHFVAQLPQIRKLLSLDVQASYDGDPAARHTDEIVFCYPGIRAMTVHRAAHELYRLQVPLLPRMMAELAHAETGIDIHPGARIGKCFFIDHGTGVVIGETAVIGDYCRIYQGVTLGAASFEKDENGRVRRGSKRHPTLEDHVTVYAGATILGGDTVIGAGSQVNGGVFLTSSVPTGHVVRAPRFDLTLRDNPDVPPAMFTI